MKKHTDVRKKKREKFWHRFRIVLTVLFALVFCVSAFFLIRDHIESRKERSAFESLQELVSQGTAGEPTQTQMHPVSPEDSSANPSSGESEETVPTAPTEPVMLPHYAPLYEQNPDFFGWISIDGMNINYPIMHTPEDPQFYLRRAFDKSDSHCGVPFLDAKCAPDSNAYIVYGHHMKDGTMFGHLTDYAEEDFYLSHQTIHFDTLYEQREYQVFAVFYCDVSYEDNGSFAFYKYTDLSDDAVYDEFISQLRQVTIYETDFEVENGTDILMLSTCSYHTSDGRFVVVAKRV